MYKNVELNDHGHKNLLSIQVLKSLYKARTCTTVLHGTYLYMKLLL